MCGIAVKVLATRLMYGMKHRWIVLIICIVYTASFWFLLLLMSKEFEPIENDFKKDQNPNNGTKNDPKDRGNPKNPTFGDTETARLPDPLEVVIMPDNNYTKGLLIEAYRNLERWYNSSLNVHARFTGSSELMKRALARSTMAVIGVEVHKIAPDGLQYTLRPVIRHRPMHSFQSRYPSLPSTISPVIDDSGWLLQLQHAIDSAYIHKYFPTSEDLQIRSLPMADNEPDDKYIFYVVKMFTAHFMLSLSLLFIMSMLALFVITDRLSGVRELLCINGIPRWMANMSWLILFFLLGIILAVIQTGVLQIDPPYFTQIHPIILGIFLLINNLEALVFVNLVANLMTHKLGAFLLIILYWLVTALVNVFLINGKFGNNLGNQTLISILPNFGPAMFLLAVLEYELNKTEHVSFGNLFSPTKKFISPGLALIMMVVGLFIYLALVVYLDFVKPGPYGRARPWYLCKRKDRTIVPAMSGRKSVNDGAIIEEFKGEPIGLKCVNIVKVYGAHKALNNVNLSIAKNKITVLLGHNGAGKTTLFSILCGMFSPTSGDVFTDEYSVFLGNNLAEFRRDLGYCPQENLLLNDLTVEEHMIIFGMLKGWSKTDARDFSNKWTRMFDMYDRRYTQAKNLSGGTKRKLCLAIAMTGEPKYLLLDEPSAGMDIESTRKFWDVLLKEKGTCTVIITTHDMDEAEVLGDRIAILAHGQLKCHGSASFLKKNLDIGYRLNCAVLNRNPQEVIRAVTRVVSNAGILYKTNRSVTFSIPGNMESYVPELLRTLESRFGESVSSTLSVSTLDDVFVQVQKDVGVKLYVEELPIIAEEDMSRSCWNFVDLFMRRVKWIYSPRVAVMILLVILLPCLGMVVGMSFPYNILTTDNQQSNSNAVNSYDSMRTFAVISNQSDGISGKVRSALTNSGITFTESSKDVKSTLTDLAKRNYQYGSKLLFAFDSQTSETPTAFFPRSPDHSSFTAYSTLINAMLQGNATIVANLSPFTALAEFADSNFSCLAVAFLRPIGNVAFFGLIGLCLLTASSYFIIFPHEERVTLFKHLLLMTGLLPEVYWLVNLTFDMLLYLCTCALLIIIITIMDQFYFNVFMEPSVIGSLILVFLLYGLSSILFSYIWSFIHKTYSVPVVMLVLGSLILAVGVRIVNLRYDEVKVEWIHFIPWSNLWSSMVKIFVWALEKAYCDRFDGECKMLGCKYVKDNPLCGSELKVEISCFAVFSVVYFLILLFLDHGMGRILMDLITKVLCGSITYPYDDVNSQVALEKKRVDELAKEDEDDHPEIVVDGLGKNYCGKTAVYDVTFTAERGECFGLVGVNGAGKSTTFRMLVALTGPTEGTAVIEGRWKVTGCNYNYLKRLGYCPQSDGLLKELSARAILQLFGRIGGVPRDRIKPLVDKWITALDMTEIANRPCGHYSGGNKRKLSLAISLIGNPPVTLLDEPTAGVDPIVRRKIYEILTTSLETTNKTIILTSHTMSECEAICDRLTIMVKGVMKCLGPIPQLKKVFGKSCILDVKFSTSSSNRQKSAAQSKIESYFSGIITLTDIQPFRLVYTLKTENVNTYDVFASMLKIKSENSVIEDFNVSETPLEQVFLLFAKK